MDRNDKRAERHGLLRAQVQVVAGVPQFLPVRAARRQVRHALLSPERGHERIHLLRHTERQVDGAVRRAHGAALHPEPAGRAQHTEPSEPAGGQAVA